MKHRSPTPSSKKADFRFANCSTAPVSSPSSSPVPLNRVLCVDYRNEFTQILFLQNLRQTSTDIRSVDDHMLLFQIRSLEAHILDDSLQDGVQTSRADVLRRPIHFLGDVGQGFDPVRPTPADETLGAAGRKSV